MSHAKKLVAGVAVIAIAAGATLPGVTGYILEKNIQDRLEQSAAKYDFSVSSIELNRSFGETDVEITLEGEGVRKLSQESLSISGSIQHNSVFALPALMTADLEFTYHTFQQGIQLGLPGAVLGTISWNGSVDAAINTDSLELPLDPMGVTTLILEPASGQLWIGDRNEPNVALDLSQLNWTLTDDGEQVMSVSVEPSKITVSSTGETWTMAAPSLSMNLSEHQETADLTLQALNLTGQQTTENQMLNSQVSMSAGQLTIPALEPMKADKVIEGFTLSSSVENVTEDSISQLAILMKESNLLDNQEAVEKAAKEFLVDLSAGNPRFALDDFTLKTTNGDLGIAFAVEGTDQSRDVLNTIVEFQHLSREQEDELANQFMLGMNSSAKVTLSDDLVNWSCERVGEQVSIEQGASAAEAEFIGSMCKTMADSGEFLSVPCMEITDPKQQAQCMDTMSEVKVVWAESKTLEVAYKEGQLMLNGAIVELPAAM